MILLVYTSTADKDLVTRLGCPEYSYRFVIREFMPLLHEFGKVIDIADPEQEVDAIYASCVARAEPCLFLCFMPPGKTPLRLNCPTIPVFAWEYDNLPNEAFRGRPRNDWTRVLARLGNAITHSSFVAERTRAVLGPNFPIACIPAPLWDRMQRHHATHSGLRCLAFQGLAIDCSEVDLTPYRLSALKSIPSRDVPLPPGQADGPVTMQLEGVVYTAIFNPQDGRKNWRIMISAFCEALREREDATLLLKLTHRDANEVVPDLLQQIHQMGRLKCRVVLIHAYLSDEAYNDLIRCTTYALNTSHGEGQCLPLMEYMSSGKPAVAPRHTSMLDYIDDHCAFVVDSSEEIGCWPQDPRQVYRTLRQRIHYGSLVNAFRNSYHVAKHEPETYKNMSHSARQSLKRYCSMDVARSRFKQLLAGQCIGQAKQIA
ncbi:MAG TPA: glycosyltransferase [Dyella sp.]|uniref:glycosyltransferase n=1 Tax=Dyella sp. TaxID=1869338 RepID=UPI002B933DCD|nr:glycosyltransferase [Dyella sp.]HTV84703.1 glycosyltransferase [Dyella sp.]